MTGSKCYDIDTFHFCNDNGRLYIFGIDEFALHYDLKNKYDVISALIDFSRPHSINELDFNYPRNSLHKNKLENSRGDFSYPTGWMTENGVRTLYQLINGVELGFNYSHKNFVERCEQVSIQKPGEIFVKPIQITKTNNRNLKNPNYNHWRESVLKRDGFKCIVCGDTEHLEAHHMYGYKENPDLATEVSNGITLCKWCHKKYHSRYGVKDINPVDFVNFIKRFGVR